MQRKADAAHGTPHMVKLPVVRYLMRQRVTQEIGIRSRLRRDVDRRVEQPEQAGRIHSTADIHRYRRAVLAQQYPVPPQRVREPEHGQQQCGGHARGARQPQGHEQLLYVQQRAHEVELRARYLLGNYLRLRVRGVLHLDVPCGGELQAVRAVQPLRKLHHRRAVHNRRNRRHRRVHREDARYQQPQRHEKPQRIDRPRRGFAAESPAYQQYGQDEHARCHDPAKHCRPPPCA